MGLISDIQARAAGLARVFDPRFKVIMAFVAGVCVLRASVPVVVGVLALMALFGHLLRDHYPAARSAMRAYGLLILFWMTLKVAVDWWEGFPLVQSAEAAGILGLRLSALFMTGLVLAMSTSSRALGSAFSWFLKPVMGKNSWQGALALALFIHILPHSWEILSNIMQSVAMRCPGLGFFRKTLVIAQALVRCLSQMTWKQTLAVAARRLDAPDAWQLDSRIRFGESLVCLGFCLVCLWFAFA